MVDKVISGGQTGVDRAALDAALGLGIECGGWCPEQRIAEDGPIDPRYPLTETGSDDPDVRTAWNVRDADATLVLLRGSTAGSGTALTIRLAGEFMKPSLLINLYRPLEPHDVRAWLRQNRVHTLNIAGPRESQQPGIYEEARAYLLGVLA
jgi:hypothetical protein